MPGEAAMTPFASRRLHHRALTFAAALGLFAAALGLPLLAAPNFVGLAHAFTLDNQSNTNSDGSAKYVDPDAQVSRFGTGPGTIKQGNTTIQFGSQRSFDQRYNADRMFEPLGRLGEPDGR
jgi:hypothetical protein